MSLKFIKKKNGMIYFKDGKVKKNMNFESFPENIHRGTYFEIDENNSVNVLIDETLKSIWRRKIFLRKLIFSIIGVLISIVIIVCFILPLDMYIINNKNYKEMAYMKEANEFLNERSDVSNRVNTKLIKDFDLRKYTISFKNMKNDFSTEGNCFGIAYIEKMNYLGKLPKNKENEGDLLGYDITKINKSIGDYNMDEDSINKIYGLNHDKNLDSRDKFNSLFYDDYKPKDLDLNSLYTLLFNKQQQSYDDIKQKDIKEMLQAITYYQFKQKDIKPKTEYIPYVALGRLDAINNELYYYGKRIKSILGIDKYAIEKEININDFVTPLEKGEPLVVSVFNNSGGHALLAYGYEVVGEDYLKIYVKDNNIPLFSNKNELNAVNYEIKNNCYILLKKINNKWYFKYDPIINNKYIYEHKYNSYMPDAYMKIY
ncbi:hypothetical protein SAMN02745163_00085 [Clostridium cavendishii DSM 21758]|uniref:Uncharacterized protein n=1 Tax=Clostridium cavendishii DSM 21758 TaxID=1121302 RepID=A0A1M6AHG7_9CLOT|nr:hypothetical protein [Clostridium cavendishii]SHI35929.1 hypothetical protein SAMN02745163_00085 [Clostridium cavendishii DSM 21758]